jgi:hypothetical protein
VHQAGDDARAVVEVVDGGVEVATVVISGAVPDLFVVDVTARLQLAARQLGWTARLRAPSEDLRESCDLAGLGDQLCGQPERREDADVEEVVQPDDPPA